jgi:hypothetical protein
MLFKEFRDLLCVRDVPLHAHVQRLDPGDGQKRIHRRQRRTVIAQSDSASLGGEGNVAKILVEGVGQSV